MCKSCNSKKAPKPPKNELIAALEDVQFLREKGVRKDALVIYTKFVRHSSILWRTTMFKMRFESQKIITQKEQQKWMKTDKYPRHSVCGKNFSFMEEDIRLVKTKDGHLNYTGLAQCGLIWRCPFCSFKLLEQKKKEIYQYYKLQHLSGHRTGFITLTLRHQRKDPLNKTLSKLTKNYTGFTNTRWFGKHRHLIKGFVKATEITYTKTGGWHPHFHFLFFYNEAPKEILEDFQNELIKRWAKFRNNDALAKRQDAKFTSDELITEYIAKWDIVKEITGSMAKNSYSGKTPMQLLKMIATKDYESYTQYHNLKKLWREYITYTKGKPRVYANPSLKEAYPSVKELTVKETLEQQDVSEIIVKIQAQIWKQITAKNLEPHLMNYYEKDGIRGIYELLHRARITFNDIVTNEDITIQ